MPGLNCFLLCFVVQTMDTFSLWFLHGLLWCLKVVIVFMQYCLQNTVVQWWRTWCGSLWARHLALDAFVFPWTAYGRSLEGKFERPPIVLVQFVPFPRTARLKLDLLRAFCSLGRMMCLLASLCNTLHFACQVWYIKCPPHHQFHGVILLTLPIIGKNMLQKSKSPSLSSKVD